MHRNTTSAPRATRTPCKSHSRLLIPIVRTGKASAVWIELARSRRATSHRCSGAPRMCQCAKRGVNNNVPPRATGSRSPLNTYIRTQTEPYIPPPRAIITPPGLAVQPLPNPAEECERRPPARAGNASPAAEAVPGSIPGLPSAEQVLRSMSWVVGVRVLHHQRVPGWPVKHERPAGRLRDTPRLVLPKSALRP